MRKHVLPATGLALATALALTACGGSGEAESNGATAGGERQGGHQGQSGRRQDVLPHRSPSRGVWFALLGMCNTQPRSEVRLA